MNASGQQDGSSRVEREVLEILERAEAAQSPVENLHAAVRRQTESARIQVSRSADSSHLRKLMSADLARIVASLVLAVAAAVVANASPILAFCLAIASAVVFFSLWLPTRGSTAGGSPRWRGQDLRDRGPPPFGPKRDGPREPRQ